MEKIDVVIPLGTGTEWENHEEIRYCLRSLETNFLNLRNIYIIGYLPDFIQNVTHIECEDVLKHNKDGNIINKVLIACRRREVSKIFLRLSDDQLILKPIDFNQMMPLYNGNLVDKLNVPDDIQNMFNRFLKRLKNTLDILQKEGKTTFNYEIHCPTIVDKDSFIKVMSRYPKFEDAEGGYTINSLYFNNLRCNSRQVIIKDRQNKMAEAPEGEELLVFNQGLDLTVNENGATFLNYDPRGLTPSLKEYIKNKFPNKSKYEK